MSITRKLLKGMGLTDEQQETIMEAHLETVDGLKKDIEKHKADVDRLKADADKLPAVQKELDNLKAVGDGGWKEKHDKVKKEFDQYKADQTAKDTYAAKEKAYREILKAANINEKRVDTVIRSAKADGIIDGIELDENGGAKDADKLTESVKAEWADFVLTTETTGAQIAHPPATPGGVRHTMTIEEIMGIKDTAQRQNAMAQNLDLFGIK